LGSNRRNLRKAKNKKKRYLEDEQEEALMQMNERSTVVCVIDGRDKAEKAIEELYRAGFTEEQIGFAMRGGEATVPDREPGGTGAGATVGGAVTGGAIGGVLGAIAAGLIPGIGPVIAGGILVGVIGGAAAGAAAGGLVGALMDLGVSEEEAHYYELEFQAGRAIVTVRGDGRYDEAADILRRYGTVERPTQVGPVRETSEGL
jgi:hypothetical protein